MPTQQIASWLVKHSDVPLTVIKPVATKLGVSTNHLGAALFAGQIVYENQDTIVEYANRGGLTIGRFLHEQAAERYGEDHALTASLGENVEALNEAFEGTEEEAATFAGFYRQLRQVDRDTPDLAPGEGLLDTAKESANETRDAMNGAKESVRDAADPVGDAKDAVRDARNAVSDARGAVGDARGSIRDVRSDSESEAVEIPVIDAD
jgi:methyl-accepting chemotaxis protein